MADEGRRDDLSDLKIAFQVMSHDGMRVIVPALSTLVGVVTCSCLFVWSWMELQKFSPEIAMTRFEAAADTAAEPALQPTPIADATPAKPVRKAAVKRAKKPAAKAPRRTASRMRPDEYMFAPDNPTGGRVVRYTDSVTEYSWD